MSAARKPTKRTRKSPQDMLDAVQQRLDATPERLARAKDAGQTPTLDASRTRRMLDPFDTMRANRVLAPNNPKLNMSSATRRRSETTASARRRAR